MDHADYYRRLALATFELANACCNPESKRHLVELAEDYQLRAESFVCRPVTTIETVAA